MINELADRVTSTIRNIPDFPKEGILFKDITPVLEDGDLFSTITNYFAERYEDKAITKIVGIESRGFIFGSALAHELETGLVLIRKPGKLPYDKIGVNYDLEYGSDRVEMHVDALGPDDRVILIDDLLATGGTAAASIELIEQTGATIVECAFLIELSFLNGGARLGGHHTHAIVKY